MRPLKGAYAASVATLAVILPVFLWSILTEKTRVRLEAEGGSLVLKLDDKRVGHAAVPPYRTATLGLMLRRNRQSGEGFWQGWGPIELRAQKTGRPIFPDRSAQAPPMQWQPFTGAWAHDVWGHYALRHGGGNYTAYGETRLEDAPLEDFVFEGTVFNLSSAGISLTTNDGNKITVHIDVYPGPVIGWFYDGREIGTTYGVDLSSPDEEKINLWPGKSKILKNLLAKISGTVLAAAVLCILAHAAPLLFSLTGSIRFPFWTGGAERL